MRIQQCSTYTSGCYQATSAEETLFCQGFNPCCFCKEKSSLEQSMMLDENSSLIGIFEGN
ncbi:hypothetical protein DPMN_157305 [Dreissena polymorpha]|uniref:Uncharacterized protein n=1 Tax=Dreissena polymorpha TaxID=45954 RepID=A0A9D4EFP1_DREPO|nr:hypothetical protein DPMN_157305 [Dreissena polymorpha]